MLWPAINVWARSFLMNGSIHSRAGRCSSKLHTRFQYSYAESLQNKAKYSTTLSGREYQNPVVSDYKLFFFIQMISHGLQPHRLESLVQIFVVTELSQLTQKHSKPMKTKESARLIGPSAHMSTGNKCTFQKHFKIPHFQSNAFWPKNYPGIESI